jgi:hypothetical protein
MTPDDSASSSPHEIAQENATKWLIDRTMLDFLRCIYRTMK